MPRCSLSKARNRASSVGLMTRYSPVTAGISQAGREKKRAARGGPRLVRRRLELALGLRRGDLRRELAAGHVVGHAEDPSLVALDERVRAVHLIGPVLVGQCHVARHVEHEAVERALAAKDVELAVDDL